MSALESTASSVNRPNDRDDILRVLSTISVNLFVDLRGLITLNPVCGER